MVQSSWETVWRFLKKIKIELPFDIATHSGYSSAWSVQRKPLDGAEAENQVGIQSEKFIHIYLSLIPSQEHHKSQQ